MRTAAAYMAPAASSTAASGMVRIGAPIVSRGSGALPARGSRYNPRMRSAVAILAAASVVAVARHRAVGPAPPPRPRARDLGVAPGVFPPGPLNAITDVAGRARRPRHARSRATTSAPASPRSCRTAATCSRTRSPAPSSSATPSASSPARRRSHELGTIETPIVLTNTLAVGAGDRGAWSATRWRSRATSDVRSVNALVGETNDGGLNDIRGLHVRATHVARGDPRRARRRRSPRAASAPAPARCASAGRAASAPRRARLPGDAAATRVGVLVQTNFGGVPDDRRRPGRPALGRYAFATRRRRRARRPTPATAPA